MIDIKIKLQKNYFLFMKKPYNLKLVGWNYHNIKVVNILVK